MFGVGGVDGLSQQFAIRSSAVGTGGTERKVARVRCDHGVVDQAEVGMDAGPAIALGAFHHGGAHRVELDVTVYGHQVSLGADDAGLEATLSQWPAAAVPMVERLDVALANLAHRAG